jgi:hypothetical protein
MSRWTEGQSGYCDYCAVLEQRGEGAGAWMSAVRGMGESVRTVRTGPVQYVQGPYSTYRVRPVQQRRIPVPVYRKLR